MLQRPKTGDFMLVEEFSSKGEGDLEQSITLARRCIGIDREVLFVARVMAVVSLKKTVEVT